MSYIISVIVSVLILGTLLRCTNYKVRERNSAYDYWEDYPFVDMGRYKFPVWVYILSIISSLVFIWNYIYTVIFCIIWAACRFDGNKDREGYSLEEIKFYLNNKYIDKCINFLNKGI